VGAYHQKQALFFRNFGMEGSDLSKQLEGGIENQKSWRKKGHEENQADIRLSSASHKSQARGRWNKFRRVVRLIRDTSTLRGGERARTDSRYKTGTSVPLSSNTQQSRRKERSRKGKSQHAFEPNGKIPWRWCGAEGLIRGTKGRGDVRRTVQPPGGPLDTVQGRCFNRHPGWVGQKLKAGGKFIMRFYSMAEGVLL